MGSSLSEYLRWTVVAVMYAAAMGIVARVLGAGDDAVMIISFVAFTGAMIETEVKRGRE